MHGKQKLNREGELNTSSRRQLWINGLDEESRRLLEEDEAVFISQSMSTPCMDVIIDADGCYLQAMSGKKYLDFHGNSVHQIGYKNPYVIEAVKKQLESIPFIPRRYTADIVVEAASRLIDKTLSKDYKALFVPSGSAAVGLALKIARKVTGRHKVISMWESFHGAGLDAISAGGEYVFSKDMGPLMPGSIKAIPYNAYRSLIRSTSKEAVAQFCLDYIEYIIQNEGDIGALLLEPIRATDVHVPPVSYFQRLKKICATNDILLIFDEIPTALGRSGAFYAHQLFGIEPDILVLGKGLGGGVIPQAAVLAKSRLDCAHDISLGHYTHEKPAAGSAAICATLNYIAEFKLLDHCNKLSALAVTRSAQLFSRYECLGDIRIAGLLICFECVKDRKTKEKDENLAERLLYACLKNGLSFKLSAGNCIVWHPPLIVTTEQIDFAFSVFEKALQECTRVFNI
jgi:4-aminobutyrate aminotransferase